MTKINTVVMDVTLRFGMEDMLAMDQVKAISKEVSKGYMEPGSEMHKLIAELLPLTFRIQSVSLLSNQEQ